MSSGIFSAEWIGYDEPLDSCPVFFMDLQLEKTVRQAELQITAAGIYKAFVNGQRVGHFEFAPGCTNYDQRLQYQSYDVTKLVRNGGNRLEILVGKGWFRGRISEKWKEVHDTPAGVIASLQIVYQDGTSESCVTDETWMVRGSHITEDDLYDGETYDAAVSEEKLISFARPVVLRKEISKRILVPQEGEEVHEQEIVCPEKVFVTHKGETVIDFGQNITGYVSFSLPCRKGDVICYTHAEVLDSNGNVYRDNYRSAKTQIRYIAKEGINEYKPSFTFTGFRYAVLLQKPENLTENQLADAFRAIAVYSGMERTGFIDTGCEKLNQLYSNTIWSQRDNFLDIPTDCPQRDERMGWTGDAQVFCRTAALNYDVRRFMRKWCADLRTAQRENGSIPDTVPNFWRLKGNSTAWGDVICILPWNMYLAYGDAAILQENFEAMKKWVDYITNDTTEAGLWMTEPEKLRLWGKHYGDWLGLDAPAGSYIGATDQNYIASVFYAYSASLVVKAGKVLGRDVTKYEALYEQIIRTFKKKFSTPATETEMVLALYFDMTDRPQQEAEKLAETIRNDGYRMRTGFVGTPYLLHALSKYGYDELAYDLLLREEYPSWLYSVNQGATTIWEHWDGVNDEGKFWSSDMNSFNHYSYGSVFDWVYSVAAGIRTREDKPGYEELVIAPHPDKRLGHLSCRLKSVHGEILSSWRYNGDVCIYEIHTPVPAAAKIGEREYRLRAGERLIVTE